MYHVIIWNAHIRKPRITQKAACGAEMQVLEIKWDRVSSQEFCGWF